MRRMMLAGAIWLMAAFMLVFPAGCSLESAASLTPLTPSAIGFVGAHENDSGYSFFVLDTDSGNQTRLAPALAMLFDGVWSPDRKKLAYLDLDQTFPSPGSSAQAWFSLTDTDDQNQRKVADLDRLLPASWSWSPDGRKLVIICNTGGQAEPRADGTIDERYYVDMFSVDLSAGQIERLTDSKDLSKWDQHYSPDGQKIGFIGVDHDPVTWDASSYGIYTTNPDGSGLTKLLDSPYQIRSFQWSPDGKKIVYSSYDEKNGLNSAEIYVLNVETGTNVDITNTPDVGEVDPAWSPDGKKIAFCSVATEGVGGSYHLRVMNADGSGTRDLYDLPEYPGGFPSWSPDGKSILFTDRQAIYSIGADGKNLKVILDGKGTYRDVMYPVWLFR